MDRPLHITVMGDEVSMAVTEIRVLPSDEGFQNVTLSTSRGDIICRYYPVKDAETAVVMVGGVGGGFDSPANNLYGAMVEGLAARGVAALRVRYRHPHDLAESTADVLAGLRFLRGEGVRAVALVGHSLGGAVVVHAAARSPLVKVIVTLSTQSYGVDPLGELEDGVAALFIHGGKDRTLPTRCSSYAYNIAKEPKELIIHDEADHSLDQASREIYDEVMSWLSANLR